MRLPKYELTTDCVKIGNTFLHRIRALRDFSDVKKGSLGGYVEKEDNLSHDDDCWIYENGRVYENALVKDRAKIYNKAQAYGYAVIEGNSIIKDKATISGVAIVEGKAIIEDYVVVYGPVTINGGNISGNTILCYNEKISDRAYITSNDDVFSVCNIGSRKDVTTFYRSKNKDEIIVNCGCFNDTIDEFEKAVLETHGIDSRHAKVYNDAIIMAKHYFKI